MPYYYYVAAVIVIGVIIGIIVIIRAHTGKNQKIKLTYEDGKETVMAQGIQKEYVILIGDEFEFLVQNGQIVSSRCKSRKDKVISYSGGENE